MIKIPKYGFKPGAIWVPKKPAKCGMKEIVILGNTKLNGEKGWKLCYVKYYGFVSKANRIRVSLNTPDYLSRHWKLLKRSHDAFEVYRMIIKANESEI